MLIVQIFRYLTLEFLDINMQIWVYGNNNEHRLPYIEFIIIEKIVVKTWLVRFALFSLKKKCTKENHNGSNLNQSSDTFFFHWLALHRSNSLWTR